MLIHCLVEKRKTNTLNVTAHIAVNGAKYIKGKCASCGRVKTRFVSDQEIAGEGLGSFFKKIAKKVAPAVKHVGKNIINNPQRAFELGQQSVVAAMTRNPAAIAAMAPQLGKFAVTGKGVPISKDRFVRINQVVPTDNKVVRTKLVKPAQTAFQAYQFPQQTPAKKPKKTKGKGLYLGRP